MKQEKTIVNVSKNPLKNQNICIDDSLGMKLKEIMLSVYPKQIVWAMHLNVNKSSISHWFSNRHIPSEENVLRIREIVNDIGDFETKAKLKDLYQVPLVLITPDYESFKADNLEEYCTKVLIEKIVLNLKSFPDEKTVEYYTQVSLILNVFSTFDKDERKTFTFFLKNLFESLDFKKVFISGFNAIYDSIATPSTKTVNILKSLSLEIKEFDGGVVFIPIKSFKKILDR